MMAGLAGCDRAGPAIDTPEPPSDSLQSVSEKLFGLTTEGSDDYQSITGRENMECSHSDGVVKITIKQDLFKNHALSVIMPDGDSRRIYFPMEGGYLANGLSVSTNSDGSSVAFSMFPNGTMDPLGRREGADYDPAPVVENQGRHVFIVSDFLPIWYADYRGDARPEQFEIQAFCVLTL